MTTTIENSLISILKGNSIQSGIAILIIEQPNLLGNKGMVSRYKDCGYKASSLKEQVD
ncbi:hypothetical protein CEXT_103671, partial [Caerostris extrusa]